MCKSGPTQHRKQFNTRKKGIVGLKDAKKRKEKEVSNRAGDCILLIPLLRVEGEESESIPEPSCSAAAAPCND
jgi:hypothetical protein